VLLGELVDEPESCRDGSGELVAGAFDHNLVFGDDSDC
jgi:hypothetical protein